MTDRKSDTAFAEELFALVHRARSSGVEASTIGAAMLTMAGSVMAAATGGDTQTAHAMTDAAFLAMRAAHEKRVSS